MVIGCKIVWSFVSDLFDSHFSPSRLNRTCFIDVKNEAAVVGVYMFKLILRQWPRIRMCNVDLCFFVMSQFITQLLVRLVKVISNLN